MTAAEETPDGCVCVLLLPINGERYTDLDPCDEDDLQLLILGEHPNYQRIVADPASDELADGVNPRFHPEGRRRFTRTSRVVGLASVGRAPRPGISGAPAHGVVVIDE